MNKEGEFALVTDNIIFPGGASGKTDRQTNKSCLPMQETWEMRVQSLAQEDPLEEGVTTHSSILARKILRTEEPGGLQATGLQRVGHDFETEHTCAEQVWCWSPSAHHRTVMQWDKKSGVHLGFIQLANVD